KEPGEEEAGEGHREEGGPGPAGERGGQGGGGGAGAGRAAAGGGRRLRTVVLAVPPGPAAARRRGGGGGAGRGPRRGRVLRGGRGGLRAGRGGAHDRRRRVLGPGEVPGGAGPAADGRPDGGGGPAAVRRLAGAAVRHHRLGGVPPGASDGAGRILSTTRAVGAPALEEATDGQSGVGL